VLSSDQLVRFAQDGYVVVPGVVPEDLLMAVDAEIDQVLEQDPPPTDTVGHHFYFLAPSRLPAADAALRQSDAMSLAEQLVSPARLNHAFDQIQIALNVPPYRHRPGGPHLDGHRPDQERPSSFTMLAALFLVDESAPNSGNLWVWPGSHLVHQQMFATRGTRTLLPVSGHTLSVDAPPALAQPHPVLAERGDLLLAHFLLGHNIGGNLSQRTRRILYYRLSCNKHQDRWEDTFIKAFSEYPPLHAISR
jgi:ectoine hydroxylase-related dioxygenase (phytanoyl-CoA dioxygenase family)